MEQDWVLAEWLPGVRLPSVSCSVRAGDCTSIHRSVVRVLAAYHLTGPIGAGMWQVKIKFL